jgi:hypothetical protein
MKIPDTARRLALPKTRRAHRLSIKQVPSSTAPGFQTAENPPFPDKN